MYPFPATRDSRQSETRSFIRFCEVVQLRLSEKKEKEMENSLQTRAKKEELMTFASTKHCPSWTANAAIYTSPTTPVFLSSLVLSSLDRPLHASPPGIPPQLCITGITSFCSPSNTERRTERTASVSGLCDQSMAHFRWQTASLR